MKAADIFIRVAESVDVSTTVAEILADVRENGDKAVKAYNKKFDGADISSLEVTEEEIEKAFSEVDTKLLAVMQEAKENITAFHKKQVRDGFIMSEQEGVVLGQKVIPLKRVGIYVPGGTAAYPSTVLMDSIPAVLAGVEEIVMTTPPEANGRIAPVILAAAKTAGVRRIFKCGGAQAVAALAYGTESIPQADKIVGPGNVFVAEAKRQVYGLVDIDMIAGPSEILIIADEDNSAKNLAADLLSQAEHDKDASAVLVTTCKELAQAVCEELERQIPLLSRAEIARESIDSNGKIILVESIEKAIEVSNEIAPEHLEVCVDDPFAYLGSICNAGSIFLGKYAPEALGDYFAGPNHTLPTSGTARFSSPLSVDDFVKKSSFTYYTKKALGKVSDKVALFAHSEGLTAHAKSMTIRFEDEKE